ncbi:MAG: hypothetical protein U0414_21100 [Polyangiaceae bacterium]
MARRLSLLAAAGTIFLAVATSCDSVAGLGPQGCEIDLEDATPQTFSGGTVQGGVYMSSSWNGERLTFRGGELLVIEHHLGAEPRSIQAWVSLGDGPLAPAAGDQAELVEVSALSLTLHNTTCSDYGLLVTADAGEP